MASGRLVWDLPLRTFHWLLALCILGSWTTAEVEFPFWQGLWMPLHYQLGFITIGRASRRAENPIRVQGLIGRQVQGDPRSVRKRKASAS